ncbi:unnamed protein product [Rotaria socialis]
MAFYGPTFPNETHYETLSSARQRFGNRSANMFFVRPARHVACPRRLKYMHDITTGYVPYVEDSNYVNQPLYRYVIDKGNNDNINKNNSFGFHNSVDAWRQQLTELAQQVNSSLTSTGEQEPIIRSLRSGRISRHCSKRNTAPTNGNADDNDEQGISKRLLNRNMSARYPPSKVNKPQVDEKPEQEEMTTQEENQDSGIWLIPILCYILKIDNVVDAQDWLVNANPTEKRLAKELISRTMQDIKNHEIDVISDISNSDQSTATSLNNVYWPYKIWQRQEKDRHQQQQQIQQVVKQSKLSPGTSLPPLTNDNSETCERATSPLRILTPARHNSVDAWRQQLTELAQQVNSSLTSTGEQEPIIRSLRSGRISRHCSKRNTAPTNGNADDNDEQGISKRLLNRNMSARYPPSKVNKPQVDEKPEQEEMTTQEENQDSGIWLIPILCYILKIDNVVDAQDWLVNANPTEKRLAKELISRTMQDIKNHEIDVISDISNSDQSTATSLNNVYWPYKIWQRQEKDRHQQQQQIQQVVKQSKLSPGTSLPPLTNDNSETCERATSPLRILTPARRLLTATNSHHISVESLVIERPITRTVIDRTASAITARDNHSQITDRPTTIQARPFSTSPSFKLTNGHTRPSRRGYRVATSLNHCTDSFTNQISPKSRGKTPLV